MPKTPKSFEDRLAAMVADDLGDTRGPAPVAPVAITSSKLPMLIGCGLALALGIPAGFFL